jgi:hypothetical protein
MSENSVSFIHYDERNKTTYWRIEDYTQYTAYMDSLRIVVDGPQWILYESSMNGWQERIRGDVATADWRDIAYNALSVWMRLDGKNKVMRDLLNDIFRISFAS